LGIYLRKPGREGIQEIYPRTVRLMGWKTIQVGTDYQGHRLGESIPSKLLLLTLFFDTIALISACSNIPTITPTPITTINRDKAIESHRRMQKTAFYGISISSWVWLVKMDGELQLIGGPFPAIIESSQTSTPTPPLPFWGTCTVILDANSGEIIVVR
jgi:hypothetical protein